MSSKNLELKGIVPAVKNSFARFLTYSGLLFFILVALTYAFVIIKFNAAVNAQPDDSDTGSKTTQKLVIDKKIVEQLKQFRDNSVNVRAIFENSRGNPFSE